MGWLGGWEGKSFLAEDQLREIPVKGDSRVVGRARASGAWWLSEGCRRDIVVHILVCSLGCCMDNGLEEDRRAGR